MDQINTRHLFSFVIPPAVYYKVGDIGAGERRIGLMPDEATFSGERLRGQVLPGGLDWILIRPDRVVTLDLRVGLQTDDGAQIAFTYRGLRHGPSSVMARIDSGEEVDPSMYYMRIMATFETAAPQYQWLTKIFAIGTGRRSGGNATYEVYEVL